MSGAVVTPFPCVAMHLLIPMGLLYNDIIAAVICQLMVFLIDLSQAYLGVAAVITPEAKSSGVHSLISLA